MSRESEFASAARELEYELAAAARPRLRPPYGGVPHREFEGEAFTPQTHPPTTLLYDFAWSSWRVNPAHLELIKKFAMDVINFMPTTPSRSVLYIFAEGREDNTGDPAYFGESSRRRANAVKAILEPLIKSYIDKFLQPVSKRRFEVITLALGPGYPIASNATAAGRAMNRSVQLNVMI